MTPQHRARIAASRRAALADPATRKACGNGMRGRQHTEAARAKISAGKKGRLFSDAHRAALSAAAKRRVG